MKPHFEVWKYLFSMTFEALSRWKHRHENPNNQATVEQFGVALYHSLAGYSPECEPWKLIQTALGSPRFYSQKGSLNALEFIIRPLGYKIPLGDVARRSDFANLDFRFRKAIIHSELLFTDEQLPWDLMAKFLSYEYDDGILSMLALDIVRRYYGQGHIATIPMLVPDLQNTANWRGQLLKAYDGYVSHGTAGFVTPLTLNGKGKSR